ncbi:MAG: hypothetical protein ABIK19_01135 [candidate division WOR-3 bacterium]
MKKYLLILTIGLISASFALPFGFEAGLGYVLQENDNHFFINGSAIFPITDNFCLRTQLASISFHSGTTMISVGTRSPLDLMLFFPQTTFNPYVLAGLNLSTGGGWTNFYLKGGAGVEFKFNEARFHPFIEGNFDYISISAGGVSTSDNFITIKAGVRVK